jgi:hypothetical protein
VEHAQPLRPVFPWRLATLVFAAIAAFELVALIALGAVHLAPSAAHHAGARAHAHVQKRVAAPVRHVAVVPQHPLRARASLSVLVLNGNGVQGAAAVESARLHALGYGPGAARNAPRHDYAQSLVMYAPGFVQEARRLARDAGVRLVSPLDGITPARLKGSQLVLILGT